MTSARQTVVVSRSDVGVDLRGVAITQTRAVSPNMRSTDVQSPPSGIPSFGNGLSNGRLPRSQTEEHVVQQQ